MSIFNRQFLFGACCFLALSAPAAEDSTAPRREAPSISVHWNAGQSFTRGHAILLMAENPSWDGVASPFRRVRGPGIQAQAVWRQGDTLCAAPPAGCGRSLSLRLRTGTPAPHGVRLELRFSHRIVSGALSSMTPFSTFQGYSVRRLDAGNLALHLRTFADGQETLTAEFSGGADRSVIPATVPQAADRMVLRLAAPESGEIPAGAEFDIAIHMVASEPSPSWPMPATPEDTGPVVSPVAALPVTWPVKARRSWYPATRFQPLAGAQPDALLSNSGNSPAWHLGPACRSFRTTLSGSGDVVDYQIPATFRVIDRLRRTDGQEWLSAVWSELDQPMPAEDKAPEVMSRSIRLFPARDALTPHAGIPCPAGSGPAAVRAVLPGVAVAGSFAGADGKPRPFCRSRRSDPRNGKGTFTGEWRQLSGEPGWVCAVSRTLDCVGVARHEGRNLPAVWTPMSLGPDTNSGTPWTTVILPVPAATVEGAAVAITDNFWIAGWCRTATSGGFRDIGCVWSISAGYPRLWLPSQGDDGSLPSEGRLYDISGSHWLAGVAGPETTGRACIWKPEGDIYRRTWSAELLEGTAVTAINRHGQILTQADGTAFSWPGCSRCSVPVNDLSGMSGAALSLTDEFTIPFVAADDGQFHLFHP